MIKNESIISGTPYDDNTWALALKHVVDFLRFDKFTILGHSMGASIGWMYASVLPDQVERIISIDQIKPITLPTKDSSKHFGTMLGAYIEAEKKYKSPQPSFRFEVALEILIMAHDGFGVKINREAGLCLLKRATKTSPDGTGLSFTRDVRLNTLLGQLVATPTLRDFYSSMKCQMLIVLGKDGINDLSNPDIKMIHDTHKATAKNFKLVTIAGDHFIHLSYPEKVATLIKDYISPPSVTAQVGNLSLN